jgi:hypothetical protein
MNKTPQFFNNRKLRPRPKTCDHAHKNMLPRPQNYFGRPLLKFWLTPCFSQKRSQCIFWGHLEGQNIWKQASNMWNSKSISTIKYQLFTWPKMKYLLFTLNFNLNVCCHISCPFNKGFVRLDPGLWEIAN